MPITPRRLGDNAPQMRVARLADGASPYALPAGVLTRDHAGVTHQLAGLGKARELPELTDQRDRRDFRHPTQALQPCDHGLQVLGHRLNRRIDGALEAHDARGGMLNLVQVVKQRCLLGRMLEPQLLHPGEVLARPGRGALGGTPSLTQQELAQPIARAQLIAFGREPRPHQIPQRLMGFVRHPHRRQVPRPIAARQLLGIAPVGLHPVSCLHRHQRRGHHFAVHSQLRELPVQHVTGRARLVAHLQALRLAELADQPSHRLGTVRNRPKTAHLTAYFRHRHRNRLRMDIQPDKSYVLHRRLPFVCGSAPRSFPTHSVIRVAANREPVVS